MSEWDTDCHTDSKLPDTTPRRSGTAFWPCWPPQARNRILRGHQQGQNAVPDLLDRLKSALADRYRIGDAT